MRFLAILLLTSTAYADHWIDRPAWPAKAQAASITWVVKPAAKDSTKRAVALELAAGSITRTIALSPQQGLLECGANTVALAKGEVGKLAFEDGGFAGYVVARAGDALSVVQWFETDGACLDDHGAYTACPRSDTPVAKLHVPAAWTLTEHVVEEDDHGKRHPFACAK